MFVLFRIPTKYGLGFRRITCREYCKYIDKRCFEHYVYNNK